MPEFRKKGVVIKAVQLNWRNWNEICDLLGGIISPENPGRSVSTFSDTCGEETNSDCGWIEITIPTPEGDMIARHGDWIIKGVKGEFYPCKPDIFAATYEPAQPGMSFGDALEALQSGKCVRRAGWNGKGMFVWLNPGSMDFHRVGALDLHFIDGVSAELFATGDQGTSTRMPNINMRSASGSTITGWLASQTDMLARDWEIAE